MYAYGPPHMDELKQDDQLEYTYNSYVRIRDVAQKTCQRRWTIGKSGERGSGMSVLATRHGDDDAYYYYSANMYCWQQFPSWWSLCINLKLLNYIC